MGNDDFSRYIKRLVKEAVDEITAYHGTGASFASFDGEHVSSGAGSQAFGWGTYVASSPKIAKDYAKMTSTKVLVYKGSIVYREKDNMEDNFYNPYRVIYEVLETEKTVRNTLARIERLRNYADPDNTKVIGLWDSAIRLLRSSRASDWKLKKEGHLLTVNIPDDNGSNYLPWHSQMDAETVYNMKTRLIEYMENKGMLNDRGRYAGVMKTIKGDTAASGEDIYHMITRCLGSDKDASMFLHGMGYTGIKYNAGTLMGGAAKGDVNYVIFDPNDVDILNREIR